jgi:hypothetical protein
MVAEARCLRSVQPLAEEIGHVAAGHALLERQQLLPRHGQPVHGQLHALLRAHIHRIVREDGAIEAERVAVAAMRGQLVGELELDALPHLAAAAVVRMLLDEGADGIGVDLLLGHRGGGGCGDLFVLQDVAPLGLVICLGCLIEVAAVSTSGQEERTECGYKRENSHQSHNLAQPRFLDSAGERSR